MTPDYDSAFLRQYNAATLASVDQIKINQSKPFSVAQQNGAYYVGLANRMIMVIDDNNFTVLNRINSSCLTNMCGIIFLKNGQTMVVACTNPNSLIFLQRSNSSSTNYTVAYIQQINNSNPHGLLYINNSFFYATSYTNNSIYSDAATNDTFWKETLVIDAQPYVNTSNGNHVAIDECGRSWFSLGTAGLLIFDKQGTLVGNYSDVSKNIFDAFIMKNYVLYLSDLMSRQIHRIEPNTEC